MIPSRGEFPPGFLFGAATSSYQIEGHAFGGAGQDWFLLPGTLSEARIGDFDGVSLNAANGEDRLVFATGLEAGNFSYIHASAFTGAGNSQARFAGGDTLEVDVNGDGKADGSLLMNGLSAASQLTAGDFLWL